MQQIYRAANVRLAALFFFSWCFSGCPLSSKLSCAAILPSLEEIIWDSQFTPSVFSLKGWLALPDSQSGFRTLEVAYNPFYYRWNSWVLEQSAYYFSPSFSSLHRWQRSKWTTGLALGETIESCQLNLQTVSPQKNYLDLGTDQGEISVFVERQIPVLPTSKVILGGGIGYINSLNVPWWSGLVISFSERWRIGYEHRGYSLLNEFQYFYSSESIQLPLSFSLNGDRAFISGEVGPRIHLGAEWEGYALNSAWGDPEDMDKSFVPLGGMTRQRYCLGVKLDHNNKLCVSYQPFMLNSQAYFYDSGQDFGKITRGDALLASYDLDWKRKLGDGMDGILSYRYLTLQGTLRGHLEFWPFTATWIDLLGLRRYFEGECTAKIHSLSSLIESPLSSFWKVKLGLNLWVVEPTGEFSSWQPIFLVFGKTDVRTSRMIIKHALLGGMTIGLAYLKPPWSISLICRQAFPIYTKRSGQETTSLIPAVPTVKVWDYGGGFVHFTLSYLIPVKRRE